MVSERMQRQIDRLFDQAEQAVDVADWATVVDRARAVLALDEGNVDAQGFLKMAEANGVPSDASPVQPAAGLAAEPPRPPSVEQPSSFVGGRYEVQRFLGEGGKKRVFLAHDTRLDRDVAFALIKTEGLDTTGRERITREAQAMGRLGAHPHIVTIFEIGEENGSPYVVNELLGGGDVEGELEADDGPLSLARTLEIAKGVARGLVFAHERGIVHRDLKPGNVWLTEDGTAKIGDFGLAVSLDRSRLTQHGMMVGTVAYMPPEQALGGETTPQADLYSLGAMLYELVTGRPPFHADDPTAIISQHINTPPVAPSWHSEHCPPDLEALILHLLAKVPADRPASAAAVLTALEAVDPEAKSASHSDSSANPLDRLARGVFVGRERELERLRSAFDDAFAGHGSVVMLVGEPGIGKTRTSLELETYARMRGGRVIWGRAHEASGAPPYRPWVQAADTYSSTWGLEALGSQVAAEDTSELSRIFPLLRQQPNYVAPPEIVDPAAAQFRLFEAYTKLLRAFASEAPLVLVLDDLHWADKPTLLLLQHFARELGRLRILVVGTYRDTELSRAHPLSEALAELNRESGFQRVNLRGLDRDEVANYVRVTAGIEPSRSLVERLHAETEGNPFFLSEIVNLMTEEGTISSESVSDIAIPEGVREALGRRLDRLSEEANALLQYAAVAGRQFAYDTLKLLNEHDDDTLLHLIEEGLAARVIEETLQAGRYQFTHALMQETLLEELSTTRRVRMHGDVGEAIEKRYGDRADSQAARLATHFMESATLNADHLTKAVAYSRRAGLDAGERAAWAEAMRQYGAALAVSEERGPGPDQQLALLLLDHGTAAAKAGEARIGWRSLLRGADLFSAEGDQVGVARCAVGAMGIWAPRTAKRALLDRALVDTTTLPSDVHAALLLHRAVLTSDRAEAEADVRTARDLVGDVPATSELGWLFKARETDFAALDLNFEQGLRTLEGATAAQAARKGQFLLHLGRLDDAKAAFEERIGTARLQGRTAVESTYAYLSSIAVLRWDEPTSEAMVAEMSPSHVVYHGPDITMQLVMGKKQLADVLPDEKVGAGESYLSSVVHGLRAVAFELAGEQDSARREVEQWDESRRRLREESPAAYVDIANAAAGAILRFGPVELVREQYEWLESGPQMRVVFPNRGADGLRGELALRLDLLDEAERHFGVGLAWCARERCPVEAGRCHQGLAEVAERRGDLDAAREHLDAAGELFARHGAMLFLDQVLAKKEILKA